MIIVLWGLQSPINIGMILRSAEVYKNPVMIFDEHDLFRGDKARETISDFACGAFERCPPALWRDAAGARAALKGTLVATDITADAQSLDDVTFYESDYVLLGNEYDGLPDDMLSGCDKRVRIPMPAACLPKPSSVHPIDPKRSARVRNRGGAPSLNVAVAGSIIMCAAYGALAASSSRAKPKTPASAAG